MDKAGRVVLPKPLREQFNLVAGDKLRLSVEGSSIRLEPASGAGEFVRKGTVLVYTGEFSELITTGKIARLIGSERETRLRTSGGNRRKK